MKEPASFRALFHSLAACLCCIAPSLAGEVALQDEYLVASFTVEEGLPQNLITSITQTPDGYLWIGTFNGLVRFDGIRFTVFDSVNTPPLKSGRIQRLYVARDGALWIGFLSGDLARLHRGVFTHFKEGLPPGGVAGIAEDNKGQLWVGARHDGSCYRFDGTRFTEAFASSTVPLDSQFALIGDSDGGLWAGRGTAALRVLPGGAERFPVRDEGQELKVLAFGRARDGGVWMGTSRGVRKWRHNQWESIRQTRENIPTIASLCEDRRGTVWMGTWDQGLLRFGPDGSVRHLRTIAGAFEADRVVLDEVRAVFEDREGNVWLGTPAGLFRLRSRVFRTFTVAHGLPNNNVRTVTEDREGNIWVSAGKTTVFPQGQPEGVRILDMPKDGARCLWADPDGSMWIGTYGAGLFHWSGGRISPERELESPIYNALHRDRKGTLWLGLENQLSRLGEVDSAAGDVRAIAAFCEDSKGRLFLGSGESGVLVLEGESWHPLAPAGPAPQCHVWSLHCDPQDRLWVGTYGGGLRRWDGTRFFDFAQTPLRLPRFVHAIVEDDTGNFWLTSNQGIVRVAKAGLNAVAEGGQPTVPIAEFGVRDGLGTSDCTEGGQPTAWKAHDGRLWFATSKGLSVVDPAQVPESAEPPPVVIEALWADNKPMAFPVTAATGNSIPWPLAMPLSQVPDRGPLRIPAGTSRIELFYSGLSLAVPEQVRFRYRLEGTDEDWVDGGTERSTHYSRLPPGTYGFRVLACNRDGVWNAQGASLAFEVLPFFWQTTWFRAITGAAVALALAGAVRWISLRKVRRRLAELERDRAVTRERERIARDLHDDVGATLTQLSLVSDLARAREPQTGNAADLGQISSLAREAAHKLDELVWAVSPRNDTVDSLVDYLLYQLEETLRPAGIRSRLDVPPDMPAQPISVEARHSLVLALKEAATNCVKYSGADEARLHVSSADGSLKVVFEDNGRGFDTSRSHPLGNGLRNMRERLSQLGGECLLSNQPGQGTRVEFRIPLKGRKLPTVCSSSVLNS